MTLWSVGHSTLAFIDFVALLDRHGITQVADIRTVPKSRRHPHFHIESLARTLPEAGIAYMHLPRLGGFRRPAEGSANAGWRNSSFRGYADYALTEEFAGGLTELRRLAHHSPTAMMCSESLWWRCHRRLVSDQLLVCGDEVWHIGSAKSAVPHQLTPFALVATDGQITYPKT